MKIILLCETLMTVRHNKTPTNRDRYMDTDRQKDTDRQTQKDRHTQSYRQTQTNRHRWKDRLHRHIDKDKLTKAENTDTDRQTQTDRQTDRQ